MFINPHIILYGTSGDFGAFGKNEQKNKNSSKAMIKYNDMLIPAKDILCVRQIQDSNRPKSMITLVKNNPKNNMPFATEYEYNGSEAQWQNAIHVAQETDSIVDFDYWA